MIYRNFISTIKGLAIISVIYAHVNISVNDWTAVILNEVRFGQWGVVTFLFMSGCFFAKNRDTFIQYWDKRLYNIIIPWLFCGSLVYLIVSFAGSVSSDLSIRGLFLYLLGYNTYLYYLTALVICYLLFFSYKNNKYVLLGAIAINIISVYMTVSGLLPNIQPYVNPFNWIGYFAVGMMYYPKEISELSQMIRTRIAWILSILAILSSIGAFFDKAGFTYWTYLSIPIQIIGMLLIIGMADTTKVKNGIMQYVGQKSFSIYLLHMPVAGLMNIVFNRTCLIGENIIKAVLVLVITTSIIYAIDQISKRMRISAYTSVLFGIRYGSINRI